MPDYNNLNTIEKICNKSKVLPIGCELNMRRHMNLKENIKPIILWNHRWEYDKNPELFFEVLFYLDKKGIKTLPVIHQWGFEEKTLEQAIKKYDFFAFAPRPKKLLFKQ